MAQRKLSTIEQTVLGLAWITGPCTTYSVMKDLSESESSYYKSRAGTAYSVAKRLVKSGLLEMIEADGKELIQITPSGTKALEHWLKPPIPMSDIAHSADFVRLRFLFLSALSYEDRLKFIDNAIASLEESLERTEQRLVTNSKLVEYHAALAITSLIFEIKTKLSWLRFVRPFVENPVNDEPDWVERILTEIRAK